MTLQQIVKFLKSPVFEDKLIGASFLKNYTWEDLTTIDENKEEDLNYILVSFDKEHYTPPGTYYKIQEDMYIFFGYGGLCFRHEDTKIEHYPVKEL